MPPTANTYTWNRPTEPGPALLRATELTHRRTHPSGELRHPWWVLDYNYTAGERVRVHSVSAPWTERPANVAHLYAPGVPYWENVGREARPLAVHWAALEFSEAGLLRLAELLPAPLQYARFFDDTGLLGRLLREIVEIGVSGQDGGYWAAHARLFQVLGRLRQADALGGDDYRLREDAPAAAAPTFAEQLQRYIHAHLAERITVAELAEEAGMSVSALAHRYRTVTGETPMATVKRARIDLAKGLLAKGYRLKEIAWQVGFTDEFHLSRTFKQVAGVSPRAYRRQAEGAEIERAG